MVRHLLGRIAALWRRAALPGGARYGKAAKETETMDARGLAGGVMQTAGRPDAAPAACSEDLLARAMTDLGIDYDAFAEREALWLHDMRRVCRTCHARSRCRRDVGTGDFARRYRHYCPNAASLARIAAGRHGRTGGPRSTPQA